MVFPPFRTAQVGLLILFLKCNGLWLMFYDDRTYIDV